ncbi:MAG: HD domain-containing protein [Candidatus Brocadiia bacterium]
MPHKFINALKEGDSVRDIYLVSDKQLRKTRAGAPFLVLELTDKSGRIKGMVWDKADEFNRRCKTGDLINCQALVEPYQNELQLKISNLDADVPADTDRSNYLAHTGKDIELLMEELRNILAGVKDPYFAGLIKSFMDDKKFVEQLRISPAAIEFHHNYVGGLLEHTVNLLQLALQISPCYHKIIDTDLLLTGTFLHDIGKIREYEIQLAPKMTDEGYLLGHTVIGVSMVEERAKSIKDFPAERLTLLKHLISSHHGQREFGAPVLPMTPEALMLHYIDNLDARLGEYQALAEKADPSSNWTERSRSQERKFYKKNSPK